MKLPDNSANKGDGGGCHVRLVCAQLGRDVNGVRVPVGKPVMRLPSEANSRRARMPESNRNRRVRTRTHGGVGPVGTLGVSHGDTRLPIHVFSNSQHIENPSIW